MREFLDDLKRHGYAQGNFLGLLNVLIGRRITRADGTVLSVGLTWRDTASWLKKVRWDRDAVRELGVEPRRCRRAIANATGTSPLRRCMSIRLRPWRPVIGWRWC